MSLPAAFLELDTVRYPIVTDVTFLGRDSARCGVVLEGESVSPRHALILHEARGYRLFDLGPDPGIRVNGVPGDGVALQDGDRIQIGIHGIRFIELPRVGARAPSPCAREPLDPEERVPGEEWLVSILAAPLPADAPPRRGDVAARLASLILAGQIVNSQLNLRELMDKLMDCALSVVYADRASLQLVDPFTADQALYESKNAGRNQVSLGRVSAPAEGDPRTGRP